MKNIDDFRKVCYGTEITATGRQSQFGINTSSILTKLIQEAGRYVERYASDLFIDWRTIEDRIWAHDFHENESFLFGLREAGVDGNAYVLNHFDDYHPNPYYYRKLYKLDIRVIDNDDIEMTLNEVEAY